MSYYIGVDVGTSSARAGLFSATGSLVCCAVEPLTIWQPQPGYYEQSSKDVWSKVCNAIKKVVKDVEKSQIKGIGFDATCSLVVMDTKGQPLSVSPSGDHQRNIIMWMDHRASKQAEFINSTKHTMLDYVGGVISLEMEMPKLLWLKQNMFDSCWTRSGHYFDLPDFLTWKSTGELSRSLCSLVCKWNFMADHDGTRHWPDDFFKLIGLEDLADNDYSKIGNKVLNPGQCCGKLSSEAAQQMGLDPGVAVATSMIDAHAGSLGVLCCHVKTNKFNSEDIPLSAKLAAICGTSTCHMVLAKKPIYVPSVWGPFFDSTIEPGYWSKPGQSAVAKLIDHVVETHSAYKEAEEKSKEKNQHVLAFLNDVLSDMASKQKCHVAELTKDLHMWPDFHGNRSPIADPSLMGMISGLRLSAGLEDLAKLYLTTVQALALGTKHIIDSLEQAGHDIQVLCACGGLSKNPLYIQVHSDVAKLPIILPHNSESVLLGSAILGACSSGDFSGIEEAMLKMGGQGDLISPDESVKGFYEKKYKVFLRMLEHQKEYKAIMES